MEKLGEEAEKTSAMLFALQSQMNTHFLYNTIEYIENIGICYVVKKIELLSTALSGVFRYSLRQENIFVLFPAAAGGKCYESQLGEQERAMPGKGTSMLIHIKKIRCFSAHGVNGWRAWGETDPSRYHRLPDGIRIDGTGENIGKSHPLTIITGDHSYEITVHVTCREGCEAGIILQYNEEIYNAISLKDGRLRIYRLGRMLAQKDTGFTECWLRMKNDDQYISFSYSPDGISYKK